MSIWNAKTEALLLESFKMGHSRSQTAAYVSQHGGVKVTRSACIGKLSRMGHGDPGGSSGPRNTARRAETWRKRKGLTAAVVRPEMPKATRSLVLRPPYLTTAVLPLPPDDPLPDHKLKALVDLEHGECRWPYGDPGAPGFGFCGQPQFPGMPYCDGHCRRAYAPPIPRSRVPADRYAVVPIPQKQDA